MPHKIKKLQLSFFVVIGILLLGLFLRIYQLGNIPAGFFCDEASNGYEAYSLLKTGKDSYGVSFPLFFKALDDYRPGIPIYLTLPFILLFGLNEAATRLPSVVMGVITLVFLYLIGRTLLYETNGLWAALIGSTMPWLIHYDRISFLMNTYVTFFTIVLYLFTKSIKDHRFIIPAFIFAALTMYTYQPAKLIIPLFVFGLLIILRKTLLSHKRETILGVIAFIMLSIPNTLNIFTGEGVARFNKISVFASSLPLNEEVQKFLSNYFIQFSPTYLFFDGDPTFITRHFTNGLTPLPFIVLPFIGFGLVYVFLKINKPSFQILLYALFLYPLGAALVFDPPFSSRSIIGAPLFAIIAAVGISATLYLSKLVFPKSVRFMYAGLIILAVLLQSFAFFRFYFFTYPNYSSDFWGWQYGAREIVQYFKKHESEYDSLIMAPEFNAPDILLKFYAPDGCKGCSIGLPNDSLLSGKKQLFAVSPHYLQTNMTNNFKTKHIIFYPNKTVAFLIIEIVE